MNQANKPYTQSRIIGIVGAKRNCKSLLMAATLTHKLIEGDKVWSNMPVHTSPAILNRRYAPSGKPIEYSEALPLDWQLLYSLDETMVEGTIGIDELGNQASSRQSSDTRNRLINLCVRQSGHRNLDFVYTARGFYRIDYYIRDETDILIECRDLCFSPWGLQHKLQGGYVSELKYYDISGSTTGKSCYDGYRYRQDAYYTERNFYGAPYLNCYDTKEIISLEEACTGIELQLKKRRIGNQDKEADNMAIQEKIMDGIANFRKNGKDVVPSHVFWKYLKDKLGVDGETVALGRLLPHETVRKTSNSIFSYNFSGVDV